MSIHLPDGLPARDVLRCEGIELLHDPLRPAYGIQPLRVALFNLMPQKPITDAQFARLLGATALPVALTLAVPDAYRSKTTAESYLKRYYRPWSEVREQSFDALIVTGAPVETLPFEDVYYWGELTQMFDWASHAVPKSLFVCWSAQAALYHRHGVPKRGLSRKAFGVIKHVVRQPRDSALRGFGRGFWTPVSRHTEVQIRDIPAGSGIVVLAESAESGLCLLRGEGGNSLYMFNHLEYDTDTLKFEHLRDLEAGRLIDIPRNYYWADDPDNAPLNRWQPYAYLFFSNWLSEVHGARCAGMAEAA